MATLKPTTPLLASNKGALKPASPLHPKIAPKTPISHPQRRCRFQSRLGRHPQRRWRFQTTGPAGLQGLAAVPVGAGRAWPGFEPKHKHTSAHQAPLVWRAPEGSAAVPVGGGGAWPGFETTRRAKLAARTARGRAAAHRHTQRPGPPAPGTPVGTHSSPAQQGTHSSPPQRAAGASGARNTSGATCHLGITKPPGPTGAGRLSQFRKLSAESRQCRGLRGRSPGGRWRYRAWKQRPSRFPPCGGPRRRRWRSAWPSRRRSRRRCLRSRPG